MLVAEGRAVVAAGAGERSARRGEAIHEAPSGGIDSGKAGAGERIFEGDLAGNALGQPDETAGASH